MGLIPAERDAEAEKLAEAEKKNRKPKAGDVSKIRIRGKIVSVSKSFTQIELTELFEAGVTPEPIYMWIPTEIIAPTSLSDPA